MKFAIGDRVAWVSQAQGTAIEKHGAVLEVVPASRLPSRTLCASLHRYNGVGLPRDHESYVIAVASSRRRSGKVTQHRNGKLYWPRVSALKQD